ncbi:NlpC/P60 family protein [Aeromicrobium sp. CTD01-1L150]|uniref:C40 family peptidase n=1 Tax=Aeromicrobium sp. CTD01-1L150 TaxID=3341830 RepID=UPI0035BFFD50
MPRHDTTKRASGLIAATAAAVLTTGLITSSATADPEVTPEDVRSALHDLSAMNEKVNAISGDVEETKKKLADLAADIDKQQARYDEQAEVLGRSVVQQQMDAPLGATVNVLGSEDPEALLEGLNAKMALDTTRAHELESFVETASVLKNRKKAVDERDAELAASLKSLKKKQAELKKRHDEVEAQLERLNAEERAQATGTDESEQIEPLDLKASGKAGKAVEFARAQVGDAYTYGGTGPNAWDCSGLTQGAWGAAGVSIPRVAGDQYAAGRDVPLGSVQPGDLVFYADMSHVGIYIGNGQVVHAANPSTGTTVTSLSERFAKAARVG